MILLVYNLQTDQKLQTILISLRQITLRVLLTAG